MSEMSRRDFQRQTLGSLLAFSLVETLGRRRLFSAEVEPVVSRWIVDVNTLGQDLRDQEITQGDWQTKLEELYSKVNLEELLKFIDFDRLTQDIQYVDHGALSLRFKYSPAPDLPKELSFGKQIFALKEGRSVVPHGHNNMSTAFLILKGEFQGKHYDRLETQQDHYIIRPTIDRTFKPGEYSTVTDFKDNIHWFKATSGTAFIYNIHVDNVDPNNSEPTGRLYLDPNGEKLKDGLIRAPKIDYEDANRLYG